MRALYEQHSVDRRFLARNYKAVLADMYQAGLISTDRPPRGSTFANDIVVMFPTI